MKKKKKEEREKEKGKEGLKRIKRKKEKIGKERKIEREMNERGFFRQVEPNARSDRTSTWW